jgi:hypothetical protein
MGLAKAILKPALKGLAKRGHKTLAKTMYKYRNPIVYGGGGGLANAPFWETPDAMDDEQFTSVFDKLVDEGLVKDDEGLGGGVIDPNDLLKYWRSNSYHRKNPAKSWMQTAAIEGSSFIPYAGIPATLGLSTWAGSHATDENDALYNDIRRKAYQHMGKPFPEKFEPESE